MPHCVCTTAPTSQLRWAAAMRRIGLAAALALVTVAPAQGSKKPTNGRPASVPKLTSEQAKQLADDFNEFQKATRREERSIRFERMVGMGPAGAQVVLRYIESRLAKVRREYTLALPRWLDDAYTERLIGLKYEQIVSVQRARRLWQSYVLHGGHRKNFQDEFLTPLQEAGRILLLPAEEVKDSALRAQRDELVELGGYRKVARDALGIDPDPTTSKLSPTNIPYPHLDQPPTFLDSLHHTERTLVLAHTVAPPGALPILLFNDTAAKEIDVQEAEYVLFGNEMRLLAGTIAWQVDPLGNAVARDHSDDRTKGLAKGHMSSIPEKRGFTHRSRRFGASRFGSEGVGGGRSGRGYIHGLSYGGGHTGPLYSLKRNCVGVGRRGNAYTSIYRTDHRIMHGCQALAGELALPPGWDRSTLRGTARAIFTQLQTGRFGKAHKLIEKARPANEKAAMLVRFFRAAVEVEVDWTLDSAAAIEAAGDVYEAHRRLVAGRKVFHGILRFDVFGEASIQKLATPELEREMRAGEAFHRIALDDLDETERKRALRNFEKRYGDTTYAAAAKTLSSEGGPFQHFIAKVPNLEKFDYPPKPNR